MKFPLVFALAATLVLPGSLAAQDTNPYFFSVDYPEDGDTYTAFDGLKTKAYSDDAEDLLIEFTGRIGSAGKSIRVIWTGGDGGKDDYVLSKYKPGDLKFLYRGSGPLKCLGFGSNRYRFIATFKDGGKAEQTLTVYVLHGHMGERAKPVIYVYPTKDQEITVNVRPQGGVTKSIPEIGSGWKVKASPNGTLINLADGKKFPYLFWESRETAPLSPMSEGFVIKADQVDGFFTEKLAYLGLNAAETKDFLEFWRKPLQASPYLFVYFHPQERIDRDAPLEVVPRPNSVIRVYFEFRPLDQPATVKPETLVSRQRSGFAVVEWGGRRP